jgi:exosortase N
MGVDHCVRAIHRFLYRPLLKVQVRFAKMIGLTIKNFRKENVLLVLLLLTGLIGGVFAFTFSYFSNTNVLIGLCLFPFTLFITGRRRNNFSYLSVSVLFAVLAVTYQVRVFYFFSLAFYFLWLIELFIGKLNILILFLILFMSPFFVQVVTILGFPLRLMLSGYAGALLKFAGLNVHVEGNMIMLGGTMFSVDEACMGLNMLVISLLMGVFVLAFRYRLSKMTLGLYSTSIYFAVAFGLNMAANVIRIIVLVFFRITPDNPMHEMIGVLCLVVYVVIPLHFLGRWLVQKYGESRSDGVSDVLFSRKNIIVITILALIVLFVGTTLKNDRPSPADAYANVHFNNLKPERLNGGISKISTDDLLIYVKTIPEFFTGEHTPLMCWKGSGYKFSGVATTTVEGITIYKGTLVKDDKFLHTVWWYSNGLVNTISQLDWRMRMLKGEPNFCLVNVTAEDEQTLMTSLKSMFTTQSLTIKNKL